MVISLLNPNSKHLAASLQVKYTTLPQVKLVLDNKWLRFSFCRLKTVSVITVDGGLLRQQVITGE